MEAQPTPDLEIAELHTQRLPLSEVTAHPQNPRSHSDRQIKELQASLTEHGYAAGSMTVQRSTMRLVKGHGVYEALCGIGCVEADFVVMDMSDDEALLFLARDNRMSDLSSFDVPKLKAITVELKKINVPLERIGFNAGELKSLESDWAKSEADNRVVVEDDPPEVAEGEPITQTGDLWHLGKHRVLCADSTCAEDVERVMGGEKADMVFTDPPYGMGKDFENDDISDPREFHSAWMASCPSSAGYLIWYDPKNLSDVIVPAEKQWGHMIDYLHLYKPNDVAFPRQSWIRISESMIVFGVPEYIEVKPYAHDTYVWNHEGKDKSFYHPTVKPMTVVCDVMSRFAADLLFDPFLGSGTTLIAADQLDRVCYGVEIAPKYCDVIAKRYIKHRESSDDVWLERGTDRITWEQISRKVKVI